MQTAYSLRASAPVVGVGVGVDVGVGSVGTAVVKLTGSERDGVGAPEKRFTSSSADVSGA